MSQAEQYYRRKNNFYHGTKNNEWLYWNYEQHDPFYDDYHKIIKTSASNDMPYFGSGYVAKWQSWNTNEETRKKDLKLQIESNRQNALKRRYESLEKEKELYGGETYQEVFNRLDKQDKYYQKMLDEGIKEKEYIYKNVIHPSTTDTTSTNIPYNNKVINEITEVLTELKNIEPISRKRKENPYVEGRQKPYQRHIDQKRKRLLDFSDITFNKNKELNKHDVRYYNWRDRELIKDTKYKDKRYLLNEKPYHSKIKKYYKTGWNRKNNF